jgi:ATP-dependent DNA helicase RecG
MTLTQKQKQILDSYQITRLCDFLEVYPFRYDVIEETDESSMRIDDFVVLEGYVVSPVQSRYYSKNKSVSRFRFQTKNNEYHITIFNRPWLKTPSSNRLCTVLGKYDKKGSILASNFYFKPLQELEGIHPIYPLKNKVTQKQMTTIMKKVMMLCEQANIVRFPDDWLEKKNYVHYFQAQRDVHFPTDQQSLAQAILTLKYVEFFNYHLKLLIHKQSNVALYKTKKKFDALTISNFINRLPYQLTDDQQAVLNEILNDLQQTKPMMRLLQGDVGSGKTVVAIIAALATVDAGFQVAFLAPTEILATQHLTSLTTMIDDPSITIAFLSSSLTTKQKQHVYQGLVDHTIDILVGTHAIFQEAVTFEKLGLVITDEQHRFGVMQRRALIKKAEVVDVLSMSATPIPRTLASALFTDLDVSTIETMPSNRQPVETQLIFENSMRSIMDDLIREIDRKHQVYVVCPAIDEASNNTRSVTQIYDAIYKAYGKQFNIAMLHGQMDASQKESTMRAFQQGDIDMLISTTVIEVGIDVANASRLVVYDAQQFGLSQLHQLRGRIGRSDLLSVCYLLTNTQDGDATKRLEILQKHQSGFDIAYQDLLTRGPGELIGVRQSGLPTFKLGNVFDDQTILLEAKRDAMAVLEDTDNPMWNEYKKLTKKQLIESKVSQD